MKTLATLVENNENKLLVKNNIQKQYIAHSDVVKLYQLFYNIIGNANKFTTKGLIKVIIQAVELSPSKINFEVVVEDNGKGISKSDIEHIFDNFYQGIVEEKIHNFGAGLGLNLCKELVELFQGNIHISSDINKGTKVTFNLLFEVRTVE
jgi:signal transduction histidine kinase